MISVVMGVYNIEKLQVFDRAVDSVLKQTMQDFEFIICDDGSTDNTHCLLYKYAKKDPRIRLLQNKKQSGLAAALNKCIAISNGSYVARQDADDLSHPQRFQKQVEFLEQHPQISFVGTNVSLYSRKGIWGKRILPQYPEKEDFLFTSPFVHGSVMFRKSAFEKAGRYRVAKETRRAEDYDLFMRMYAAGLHGANLREPLYCFLEDTNAWKRRKYRYRLDEAVVRLQGFWNLGLLPHGLPYIIKPLVAGAVPSWLLVRLKDGYTIQIKDTD